MTTVLFVPGDRPERFAKAAGSSADALVIDLEDAVAPDAKQQARDNIRAHDISSVPVIIRINAAGTQWFEDDLIALREARFDAIMLPKAEGGSDTGQVHRILGHRIPMVPLIETAAGIARMDDVLSIPGTVIAALGSLDLALDLGCAHNWESLLFARSKLVLHSRAAGLRAPLDGVTTDYRDASIVTAEAARARRLGFGGKLLIHPAQIDPVQAVFVPSAEEIAWAKRILGQSSETGVSSVDGNMIDRPVLEQAKRILAHSH
jgi:citrate lyase subunit beta/citryl-CoA lyase